MHTDALVVAGVVERDANPDEALVRAKLEARQRLHELVVPGVRAAQDEDASQRAFLLDLEPLLDRFVHADVVRRRRVVVAVADVAAPDDPRQRGHVEVRR